MGITVELVRGVFSKSRSTKIHESNARMAADKRKWSTVRAYLLCGDEFSSMIAEDSTSFNISETTITLPINQDWTDRSDIHSTGNQSEEKQNPESKRLCEAAAAAVIIQSAFRGFMVNRGYLIHPNKNEWHTRVRRRSKRTKLENMKQEILIGKESPSKESLGTSIEVQMGDSIGVIPLKEEASTTVLRLQNKLKPQGFRPKEEWDDSTVDSNISKMRIQNRLEAMTRRERALAYAFSQQLRICSKKRESKSQGTEPHMGLSWLERWMATRLPENLSSEDLAKKLESVNTKSRTFAKKKHQDLTLEEKESSGSNDVPVPFDNPEVTAPADEFSSRLPKDKLKAMKKISRRKTVPTYQYHCSKKDSKVVFFNL
ncbi:hypothetical protein Dimus_009730 [Dionaea muscipula]